MFFPVSVFFFLFCMHMQEHEICHAFLFTAFFLSFFSNATVVANIYHGDRGGMNHEAWSMEHEASGVRE